MSRASSAPELTIRPMVPADVDVVFGLEQDIYPQPWSRQVFEVEMLQPDRVYRVALLDGEIAGYGGCMVVVDDAHVTTLAVNPSARGHRLGTRLMLELVVAALDMGARHLTLEVRMSNRAAQQLYAKFGMAPVGVRKDYYRDEDALIMWATDIDSPEYALRLAGIEEALSG